MTCLAALCLAASLITVTDGDTIRAGEVRIRLFGIDAPELREPGGKASRRALSAMVRAAGGLVCNRRAVDRYGRLVAVCRFSGGPMSGSDVACALVSLGHARDWPKYSGGRYSDC